MATKITLEGRQYSLEEHETVLEGLTRQGVAAPFSCRSGICQTCLTRAVRGAPPAEAQKGLKDAQRARNYFLSCLCKPREDLEIAFPSQDELPLTPATVLSKEPLDAGVLRLRLAWEEPSGYRPGQFVKLYDVEGVSRCYSIASVPSLGEPLEVHVQRVPGGRLSNWLHDEVRAGERINVQGPLGECFYVSGNLSQPMLLAGTGSGLAPLWGIARDALRQGHRGAIHLFHGSHCETGLYLVEALRELARKHSNFHYTPCVSGSDDVPEGYAAGRASDVALKRFPDLRGWRAFLCGKAAMVKETRKRVFLAGAAMRDISADPFEFGD